MKGSFLRTICINSTYNESKEREEMEQCTDEINKIIHIKCTEEEKKKFLLEAAAYTLYDYQFNFIIDEENKNQ